MIRLVESPSAEARVAAALAFVAAQPPATEVMVVGASREAADDLARRATVAAGAMFGIHRASLLQLAARIAAGDPASAGGVPTSGLGTEALAARIAFEALEADALAYFAPVARFPGFARALAATVGELRLAGLSPDRVGALGDVRPAPADRAPDLAARDIGELLARYEAALRAGGIADRAALFHQAAALLSGGGPSPLLTMPVVLLDVPVATPAETAFVAALVQRSPAVLATVPAGDDRTRAALASLGGPSAEPPAALPAARPRAAETASALGHLRAHLFSDAAPGTPAVTGDVVFFSAPGEGREAVEIARLVLEEARAGTAFDRMAILLRAPQVYASPLETALTRAAIPAWFARGARRPHPAGRALLALLDCALEKLSARRFAEYLSLGQVPPLEADGAPPRAAERWVAPDDEALGPESLGREPPVPEALGLDAGAPAAPPVEEPDTEASPVVDGTLRTPWKWEQLLVDSSVIGGHARWQRRLAGLAAELAVRAEEARREEPDSPRAAAIDRDRASLAHLEHFALPVIERLAALPARATWAEWIAALEALVPMVLRRPERVLGVLADLRGLGPIGPVTLDEVRNVLAEELATLAERPPATRYGQVFVGGLEQARGMAFDVVFVPGLAERIFPQKPREDPLLLDDLRARLGAALPTQGDRAHRERLLLRLAAGAATRRAYLSYSRIEVAEGRPRVPSFYAMEVQRALTGRIPDPQVLEREAAQQTNARLAWPAPDDPARAIDPVEHDLASLGALLRRGPEARGRARYLLELNDRLARSLRSRWARWRKTFTPYDGIVQLAPGTRDALLASRPTARAYSPSALQRYAVCPYQFYLSAIFRLEPRDEIAPLAKLDPLTRGRLFHQVQAECLRALQAAGRLPLTPDTAAAAQAVLDATLDRVAAEYQETLAPPIARVWADEVESLRVDLRTWLEKSAGDQVRWEPFAFELAFGLPGGPGVDPQSVRREITLEGGFRLRGIVDLVERRSGAGGLRVTDHKTGVNRTAVGLVVGRGEQLQPVLYGLAVEQIFDQPATEARLSFCTRTGEFAERVVPMSEAARRRGGEVLELIDHAIAGGFLPAAPRERACAICDFRPVCGPDEERRIKGKDDKKLADLDRLPELAVSPLVDQAERDRIRGSLGETMVVEAAAGTGKTSELVARLVAVLAEGRGAVQGVVAVTFTEKAAGELKLRLRADLEQARQHAASGSPERDNLGRAVAQLEEARVSTIHGFCNDLLHERPVEARVDPRFAVLTEPEAEALYRRAFDRWMEEQLEGPPEGVRRALRRRASLDDGDPVERLRGAGFALCDWRDFRAPWRREPFAREAAVDALVAQVQAFAALLEGCATPADGLHADTWLARRIAVDVRLGQRLAPRDYDALEASLVDLARSRQFRRPRKGYDRNYRGDVTREDVLAAHARLLEALDAFARDADADLAALLQQELAVTVDRYEALKARAGRLDFLDLLLRTRNVLRARADVRAELQGRFTHLFVDEFQDTDPLQAEILLLLSADDAATSDWREVTPVPGKLFVVGDPKQSIYRFRRADVGVYQEVVALLRKRGAAVLTLTTSFRAVPSVQRLVNAAFAPRMVEDHATLQARYVPLAPDRAEHAGQPGVVALPVPKPYGRWGLTKAAIDQCLPDTVGAFVQWLVEQSGWRVTERGAAGPVPITPRHVCLLFRRFTQWGTDVTRPYVDALEARGIPHMLVGGKSFHQREEVETVRTALSAIEWPDDELSVYGALRGPLFAVGDEALLEYRHRVGRLHPFRVPAAGAGEPLGEALRPVADGLRELAQLHRRRNYRPVEETIDALLTATRAHAGFMLRQSGERALANVLRIAELARQWEAAGGISFRGFVERLGEADSGDTAEAPVVEEGTEGVRIMTVHRAKGLEFPVVILADIGANVAALNPGRHVDPERELCALRLAGWSPWDLLDHEEAERERERAEGVRVAYVAATRARDLLVVPAVGDDPFANGWEAAADGWIEPVQRAVYPPAERRRAAAPAPGCPPFGEDSVLERPDQDTPGRDNVRPGLHVQAADGGEHHGVVWWDPAALALGASPRVGIRREDLIVEAEREALDADLGAYAEWERGRAATHEQGGRPSLVLQTVTGWASRAVDAAQAAEPDVTVVDTAGGQPRPSGPRFGTLVHAVLATVPLDAEAGAVAEAAGRHARILGATAEEASAAARLATAALAHPLLARAREAWARGRCRRETPIAAVEPDGSILEGVLDLAFEDDAGWTVVDWKTQAELAGLLARHRRQVAAYAAVVARATGRPATAILMRL